MRSALSQLSIQLPIAFKNLMLSLSFCQSQGRPSLHRRECRSLGKCPQHAERGAKLLSYGGLTGADVALAGGIGMTAEELAGPGPAADAGALAGSIEVDSRV